MHFLNASWISLDLYVPSPLFAPEQVYSEGYDEKIIIHVRFLPHLCDDLCPSLEQAP
jgi:hypothetical protein